MTIVVIQFGLIIFLSSQWHKCKNVKNDFHQPEITSQLTILSTFSGIKISGEIEWFHFTSYSPKYYFFGVVSSGCKTCEIFLEEWNHFFKNENIENDIISCLLTDESLDRQKFPITTDCLKLSRDDIIQFGFDRPSFFAVNGKGEILFRYSGYMSGIFEEALQIIYNNKYKKSKLI